MLLSCIGAAEAQLPQLCSTIFARTIWKWFLPFWVTTLDMVCHGRHGKGAQYTVVAFQSSLCKWHGLC